MVSLSSEMVNLLYENRLPGPEKNPRSSDDLLLQKPLVGPIIMENNSRVTAKGDWVPVIYPVHIPDAPCVHVNVYGIPTCTP